MKKIVLTWALLALSALGIRAQGQCEFPLTIVIPDQTVELSPIGQDTADIENPSGCDIERYDWWRTLL